MMTMSQAVKFQMSNENKQELLFAFGDRLNRSVSLARYTAARIGGAADWLLVVETVEQLSDAVIRLWGMDIPFMVLGSGSNILVSDFGVRQWVFLNKARQINFDLDQKPPIVMAESGANFGLLARQCAQRGLSGLEWAAGIPGTVGGAVFGNAGAHGADVAESIQMAKILHRTKQGVVLENWHSGNLRFEYRASKLKREPGDAVILAAQFQLEHGDPDKIQAKMDEYTAYRRSTQPPGASMGSIFKNPPGDYAGRLIEAAGLKGTRIGGAQISPVHANFIINDEGASASDVHELIRLVQEGILKKFGVELELEIELVGEW
jgi:UDP-N-acetylmuramate dehydrogenase